MYQPLSDPMDDAASAAVVCPPRDPSQPSLWQRLLELIGRALGSEVPA